MNFPKYILGFGLAVSLLLGSPAPGADGGPAAPAVTPPPAGSVEARITNSEWVQDGDPAVWSFKEGGEWTSTFKKQFWTGHWKVTGPHEATVRETNGQIFVYRFDDKFTTVERHSSKNPTAKVHAVRKKS